MDELQTLSTKTQQADNDIGTEGASALNDALKTNTSLVSLEI